MRDVRATHPDVRLRWWIVSYEDSDHMPDCSCDRDACDDEPGRPALIMKFLGREVVRILE